MTKPQDSSYIWHNGRTVPWQDATIHITEVGIGGSGAIFEGIRAYWNEQQKQLHVFRLGDHLRRFAQSMRLVSMEQPFPSDALCDAVTSLLQANEVQEDSYIRPTAFQTGAKSFANPGRVETQIVLSTMPFRSHLSAGASLAMCVSSWNRITDNAMPPRIKCGANYQNSRLVTREARNNGYDDGIILDPRGKVTEASSSSLFMVRDGVLFTPPVTSSILESITRATVIEMARTTLDLSVLEREIDRTELYVADELLTCGTGREIAAVISVDRLTIGSGQIGPITRDITRLYERVVRGQESGYARWCAAVQI